MVKSVLRTIKSDIFFYFFFLWRLWNNRGTIFIYHINGITAKKMDNWAGSFIRWMSLVIIIYRLYNGRSLKVTSNLMFISLFPCMWIVENNIQFETKLVFMRKHLARESTVCITKDKKFSWSQICILNICVCFLTLKLISGCFVCSVLRLNNNILRKKKSNTNLDVCFYIAYRDYAVRFYDSLATFTM